MNILLKSGASLMLFGQAASLFAAPQPVPISQIATTGTRLSADPQPGMHQMMPQPLTLAEQRTFLARREQEIRANPPAVVPPLTQEKIVPIQRSER